MMTNDFLISDDSNNFTSGIQKIRNYTSEDYTEYLDSWAERLFSLENKGRFEGKIHEWFAQTKPKPTRIDALSGHTGYLYKDEEQKKAHIKRNLSLLDEMMEKEPNEPRWPLHALFEYHALHETDHEVRLSQKIYSMLEGKRRYDLACVRGYVLANILRVLQLDGRYEESYRHYKQFKARKPQIGLYAKAYMEIFAVQGAYHTGKTKQARKHAKNYLEYYTKYAGSPPRYVEEQYDFLMNTFSKRECGYVTTWLIDMDIEDGNWESFERYFKDYVWDGTEKYNEVDFEASYNKQMAAMVADFWKYPNTQTVIQTALLAWDPTIGNNDASAAKARAEMSTNRDVLGASVTDTKLSGQNDEKKPKDEYESFDVIEMRYENLIHAIIDADIKKGIPLDLYIIWDDMNDTSKNMVSYFRRLYQNTNPLLLDNKLWEIGTRRGAVLDDRIREIPFSTWQNYVIQFISDSTIADLNRMTYTLDQVYMGFPDEYYMFYRQQVDKVLSMAEEAKRMSEIEQKNGAVQSEMQQILDKLQAKVEELISAGMLDEAEKVMAEIKKYTSI